MSVTRHLLIENGTRELGVVLVTADQVRVLRDAGNGPARIILNDITGNLIGEMKIEPPLTVRELGKTRKI